LLPFRRYAQLETTKKKVIDYMTAINNQWVFNSERK
jgi:hypothetical protein